VDADATTPRQDPQDQQITVAVPEDRVAEFYAFFGRFLEGRRGRRGGGPRGHRHSCHGHGHHGVAREAQQTTEV
jgi:hypothetical protein